MHVCRASSGIGGELSLSGACLLLLLLSMISGRRTPGYLQKPSLKTTDPYVLGEISIFPMSVLPKLSTAVTAQPAASA